MFFSRRNPIASISNCLKPRAWSGILIPIYNNLSLQGRYSGSLTEWHLRGESKGECNYILKRSSFLAGAPVDIHLVRKGSDYVRSCTREALPPIRYWACNRSRGDEVEANGLGFNRWPAAVNLDSVVRFRVEAIRGANPRSAASCETSVPFQNGTNQSAVPTEDFAETRKNRISLKSRRPVSPLTAKGLTRTYPRYSIIGRAPTRPPDSHSPDVLVA